MSTRALTEADFEGRTLWSLVGSGASIADHVHAYAAPHDPIHALLGREADKSTAVQRWMLRLVDAPLAIAAGGWPAGLELDEALSLDDSELPDDAGDWRLSASGSEGRLERADSTEPRPATRGYRSAPAGLRRCWPALR